MKAKLIRRHLRLTDYWVEQSVKKSIYTELKELERHSSKYEEFVAKMSQARELYPFKINGDFETYNSYNEGWQDALNFVESEVNGEL